MEDGRLHNEGQGETADPICVTYLAVSTYLNMIFQTLRRPDTPTPTVKTLGEKCGLACRSNVIPFLPWHMSLSLTHRYFISCLSGQTHSVFFPLIYAPLVSRPPVTIPSLSAPSAYKRVFLPYCHTA